MVELVDVELNRTVGEGVSRVRIDEKDRGAILVRSIMYDVATMFADSPVRNRRPIAGMASIY